jgi:hypothetical protein
MNKRRRFTADFKVRVALDELRGDRTIRESGPRDTAVKTVKDMGLSGAINDGARSLSGHLKETGA